MLIPRLCVHPVLHVICSFRHFIGGDARLPDPYLTHHVRLFPHRSPRQSSASAAVGGLESPPAGRFRRPTSIFRTAPNQEALPTSSLPLRSGHTHATGSGQGVS